MQTKGNTDSARQMGFACAALFMIALALGYWWTPAVNVEPGPQPVVPGNAQPRASPRNPFRELRSQPVAASRLRFERRAQYAGVQFEYYGGPSPARYMTEQNGGGVAILDADRDGWPDLFFMNGSWFDRPAAENGATSQLFRGQGGWRFRDVTLPANCGVAGFGMGCAAGDFDNDGFPDLFGCFYGNDRLWRNNGDGTFSDVTSISGTTDPRWTSSAAWADFNGDGDLDLLAVNYVEWSERDEPCYTPHRPQPVKISCGPLGRAGYTSDLYENRGDGRFANMSAAAGLVGAPGKSLDVAVADFDEDGRLDAYVANDTSPNQLWLNQGNLKFDEVGVTRGVALNREGVAASGMGIALADGLHTGHFDLVVTNFENEVNDYHHNLGQAQFEPRGGPLGLDADSRPLLGFGTTLTDFDSDGWPELFVANGHVWDLRSLGLGHRYTMPPLLYGNDRGQRFVRAAESAGDYFAQDWIARAVARGDLDRDGDWDLVITHLEDPAELLENKSRAVHDRVRLRCVGTVSAREPRGCRVDVVAGGQRYTHQFSAGGGFQASSEDLICLPTYGQPRFDSVQITWPNGQTETWQDVPTSQLDVLMIEGTGVKGAMPRARRL